MLKVLQVLYIIRLLGGLFSRVKFQLTITTYFSYPMNFQMISFVFFLFFSFIALTRCKDGKLKCDKAIGLIAISWINYRCSFAYIGRYAVPLTDKHNNVKGIKTQ